MAVKFIDNGAVAERLNELQSLLNMRSSRAFALAIDADPAYFAKAQKGKGLSDAYLDTIVNKFGINKDWLLYGDGDVKSLDNVQTTDDKKNQENVTQNDSYQKKYISLLEDTVKQQREEIRALHEDVKRVLFGIEKLNAFKEMIDNNRISLSEVQENQVDLLVMNRAFHKMFADFVGKQLDRDPKTLLRNLHKDIVENRKAYIRKGSSHRIDT